MTWDGFSFCRKFDLPDRAKTLINRIPAKSTLYKMCPFVGSSPKIILRLIGSPHERSAKFCSRRKAMELTD